MRSRVSNFALGGILEKGVTIRQMSVIIHNS